MISKQERDALKKRVAELDAAIKACDLPECDQCVKNRSELEELNKKLKETMGD